MKLAHTPQEFFDSSAQLLKAAPTTTKVTSTYHAATPGKGTFTLKTYDPRTGAVVKLRTGKVADVGRLVAGLHRIARAQVGVPETPETITTAAAAAEATPTETPARAGTPVPASATATTAAAAQEAGKAKARKKRKGKS